MRFLRSNDIEEDPLDYKPQLEKHPINVTKTRAHDISHGHMFTLAK